MGKAVKSLRREGVIPAVVYGGNDGTTPIELNQKEFSKLFKTAGETTLIKLFVNEEKVSAKGGPASGWKNVLVHDVSRDTMTDVITHVDFYEVRMDEKITANIPLVFIGDAPAVSDLGGTLVKAMQGLEVRALPTDLPHQIEVNISQIRTFDDNILVGDIKLPKGVEILENQETSVAAVAPPRSEAEMETLSGQVEEKVEEVAVETEEKVKERSEEKTEATE
ncbi:MAG: 50S ribosomal protein L25 [Candidatus Azambacteria bacterium GW2011_GWE1_42_9]|nr:MAG: 50S ribosomal protein L25 [Candidatus Azambacteria bacterium GW2011_GWF1_41_10]KKS49617.1 MAG: 50S ribosomal protein L25 [Candidatus Azambacteria bacterium GW2011_GWF2_42_22]KKS79006.1 MAG: 50S ribosomal protein L25 [Candidatus Azambacteria bacterium GW2011_GWE1_42_9]KKT03728.1 MAG: 50S ribosomal protein L25 [Candidatus Azambacteria bacterium GW2011_GWD1_43_18]KKT12367.1 MAG: 50S ribosomal protein L25 [Candidatus Azambacteria bacterium GW2011_GWC2_43_27]